MKKFFPLGNGFLSVAESNRLATVAEIKLNSKALVEMYQKREVDTIPPRLSLFGRRASFENQSVQDAERNANRRKSDADT